MRAGSGKSGKGSGKGVGKGKPSNAKVARRRQGATLPPDGSLLSAYPEGCCVLLEATPRDFRATVGSGPRHDVPAGPSWYLVSFRIGLGSPHCRMMANPPSSLTWNVGMGIAVETNGYLAVKSSRWPERAAPLDDALGTESDPVQVMQVANSGATAGDQTSTPSAYGASGTPGVSSSPRAGHDRA